MATINACADFSITLPEASNKDRDVIEKAVRGWCKKWCYQLEKGDDGYIHWQMNVALIKKRRLQEILPKLKAAGLNFGYMSPLSQEGRENLYCMKEDTRIAGPWSDQDKKPKYIQKRFRDAELKGWQMRLITTLRILKNARNDRNIILVQDEGGQGKSFFKNWARGQDDVVTVPSTFSTANEMIEFLCSKKEIVEGWEGIILMDVPRATSIKHWYTLAAGLECIKQGFLHDKRYRCQEKVIEPPQMACFCNTMPPEDCMTRDVFKIFDKTSEIPRIA